MRFPPADSSPPTGVENCNDLCALTPTTSASEAGCVPDAVTSLGYDTDNIPCTIFGANFTAGSATVAQCTQCYATISITDADCRRVHTSCY